MSKAKAKANGAPAVKAAPLVLDLDAALEEYEREHPPFEVKFRGTAYKVPSAMPAAFLVFYTERLRGDGSAKTFDLADEDVEKYYRLVLGDDLVEALHAARVSIPTMRDQVSRVVLAWFASLGADIKLAGGGAPVPVAAAATE